MMIQMVDRPNTTPIGQDRETLTFKALLSLNVAVHAQVCRLFCVVYIPLFSLVQLGYLAITNIFAEGAWSRCTENKTVLSQFTKNKIGISRFTGKKDNVFLEAKVTYRYILKKYVQSKAFLVVLSHSVHFVFCAMRKGSRVPRSAYRHY